MIAVAAGALVGCGGAKIENKEQAAGLAGTAGSKGRASGSILQMARSAADSTGSFSASCTNGGTVSAELASTSSFTINGTIQTSSESYTYNNETYTWAADGSLEGPDSGA